MYGRVPATCWTSLAVCVVAAPAAGPTAFARTKIQDLHPAIGRDLDVGRLEVAMDDALGVRRGEAIDQLQGEPDGVLVGQRAARQLL